MSLAVHLIDLARLPADLVWRFKFRRTRRRALARFFEARATTKRVAIVGNGPSAGRLREESLAACDRVMRFNYFPHARCTDWVLALTADVAERLRDEGVAARLSDLHTLWLFRPHSPKVAAEAEALFGEFPRRELPREARESARRLLGYPPTAGMIALFAAPALFPDYERCIAGIGDGGGGRHYFNRRHRPWRKHNLRRERWVINYLVKAGALRPL